MKLTYAFIAKYAEASSDGNFSVIGGGWDAVGVTALPFISPPIAVVACFRPDPQDVGHEQKIETQLFDPEGRATPVRWESKITPCAEPERSNTSNVVWIVGSGFAFFSTAGVYQFRIQVNGVPAGMVPFEVVYRPESTGGA
jgi:hypothetical protein